jgi:hypothetical protein
MKPRIMYIELKTHPGGHDDHGPARIGRVTFSHSGKTIYYRSKEFARLRGGGSCANYYDVDTDDEYWISGCKKNGHDRHPVGGGLVEIDTDVREEYWTVIRKQPERKEERFAQG